MINLKKQAWRTGALCLAGVVALSVTGVSVYAKTSEKKETELKEQIQDAVDDIWKSEDTSAASMDETVYVILNADGTQQKIYVSDWLKNQGEKDSYTQSTPDQDAPVSIKITYTLDGSEISPEELDGKSGHVVIRYDYTNTQYETREIAGKEEKIYVPFAVMTGMILDNDIFTNIRVSSGKVINDGSHSVVTGIVFPGLGTNLNMEEDLDDYLEIEADATDFTMNESYCIATNSVFSRLDLSNVDDLDDLKDAMNDLDDATQQLMDGSSKLYDGVSELYDKSGDLKDGVNELSDGSADLRDGAYKVADGTVTIRDSIGALQSGANTLYDGTKTLLAGTQSLQSGANDLKSGLEQLTAQNDTLNGAAAQIFGMILNTANSSLEPLINAGLTPALTMDNYAEVLASLKTTLAALSTEDGARQLVLSQSGHTMEEYNTWNMLIAAAGASSSAPATAEAKAPAATETPVTTEATDATEATVTTEATDATEAEVALEAPITAEAPITVETEDVTADTVSESSASEDSNVETQVLPSEDNNAETQAVPSEDINVETQAVPSENINVETQAVPSEDVTIETQAASAPSAPSISAEQVAAARAAVTQIDTATSTLMATASSAAAQIPTLEASLNGYSQFYTGLRTYTAGVASASAGAGKLAEGSAQVFNGTSQLKDGAEKLFFGSRDLYDGADTLVNGARDLASGSGTLANGVTTLSDGSDKLIDGVSQLKDGAKELKDGLVEYNDEAISKLTELDTDELQEVIDRMKATASVSENYDSFTGDNNGVDSSVKFIYKINTAK